MYGGWGRVLSGDSQRNRALPGAGLGRFNLWRPMVIERMRGSNRPSALPAYSSMRPLKAMVRVTSSVYSSSAPTGMPRAMRVTFTPRGLISRAR